MSKSFAKNSIFGALAGSAITLGSFVSGVIVARALGVSDTGIVSYVVWLVLVIAPTIDLGVSSAVARYVPDLRGSGASDRADWLAGHLARVLAVSVLLTIGALAAAFLSGMFDPAGAPRTGTGSASVNRDTLLAVGAVFVVLQVFGAFTYAYLRGSRAFDRTARLAGLSFVLQMACVTAGSLLFGVTGAIAGYAAGALLPALAAARLLGRSGPVEPELRRRVRHYALFAWGGNIASAFIWSRIELFFLERYWGMEAVGLFAVALALTSLATQGPTLLTSSVLTLLAEKRGRNEEDGMKAAYATGTRLLAALVFPICLGMAAIMPVLLPLIFGQAFVSAVPAAMLLVCVAAASVSSVIATNLVQAVERSDFIFYSSIVGAIFAVGAGFLLVPAFGLMGAAASRAAIQILMVALGSWFVARHLKCPLPFAALLRLFLAALIAAAVAAFCVAVIRHPAGILVAVPAAAVAYVIALRFTRALPPADIALLAELATALPAPLAWAAERILRIVRRSDASAPPPLAPETGRP